MNSLEKDTYSRNKIVSDMNTNFFVEAGAGSGKTTMLVSRMVAMVESGIDIRKICAITFTKAAANEFYERFQALLIERSSKDYKWEDHGYAGQLPEPTEDTRKNCAYALKNIDLCFMGTIDSFCNMVLSEHPSEADVLSDSVLVTDDELKGILTQIYVDICNGIYGEELKQMANVFHQHTKKDKEVFCKGIAMLLEHRNAHFNYNSGSIADIDVEFAADRDELLRAVYYLMEHKELKYIGKSSSGKTKSDLAWESLPEIYRTLSTRWSTNFINVSFALSKLSEIAISSSAKKYYWPVLCKFFDDSKPKAQKFPCTIGIDNGILVKMHRVQYDASVPFLDKCMREVVEKVMRESGKMRFFDYLYYLRNVLKEDAEGDGTLIRYIYYRHSYFLIDEFQDTNPIQAEIFFYLSSEHPVGKWQNCKPRAGSLFIVGDPKQSIYRFRNADVTSFLNVRELFVKHGGEVLELSRNFRSCRHLCEYYNKSFEALFRIEDDGQDAVVNQCRYTDIPCEEAAVRSDEFRGVFEYSVNKKGEDPGNLANIIKCLVHNDKYMLRGKDEKDLRQIDYKDFMVISVGKDNLINIMRKFDEEGIPSKVEGQVLFEDSEALKEISKIYSALSDTGDQIALYAALTGNAIRLTKYELLEYSSCGGKISLISEFDSKSCDNQTAKKVAAEIERLKNVFAKARNMSPAALLSDIMDTYRIFTIADAENLEVIYYTLELMRNAEQDGTVVTLQDGKDYLSLLLSGGSKIERCLSLNAEDNRVHLANLHKVKGLEKPIVILAYYWKTNEDPSIRIDYGSDSTEAHMFTLPKDKRQDGYYLSTNVFPDERDKEIGDLEAENKRLVYVAATRARNALIVCRLNNNNNGWASLTDDSTTDIYSVIDISTDISDPEVIDPVNSEELYSDAENSCILKTPNIIEPTFSTEKPSGLSVASKTSEKDSSIDDDQDPEDTPKPSATLLGTLIHRLMEIIVSTRNKIDIDMTINEIISEYRTPHMEAYEENVRKELKEVYKTITSGGYPQKNGIPQDILKTLLEADEVYCEAPFCYKEESPEKGTIIWSGIMDVIYRSGDKWHIVDYKTNADGSDLDNEYKNQLNAYKKAFKATTGNVAADALIYHIDK